MRKQGFTLVELSFSIAFLGVLSLIIAFIIVDTVATYRRGLTLNQINTVGMDIVDDMRTAVQNSPTNSVESACSKTEGCEEVQNLVTVRVLGKLSINGTETDEVPLYGAFCTGKYSYIWNSGYFFNGENGDKSAGKLVGGVDLTGYRLVKIEDQKREVCFNHDEDYNNEFNAPEGTGEVVSLLAEDEDDNNLALYDLQVSIPAEGRAGSSLFYSVSFILGTIDGGINVKASGDFCKPPEDAKGGLFDYCAVNKFNFAVRATGGKT